MLPKRTSVRMQRAPLSEAGNSPRTISNGFGWPQNSRQGPALVAEAFLAKVGRRKFVLPLFETLMAEGEWGAPIARRIYAATRPRYHSVTQGSVDEVVTPGA